MEIKDIIKLTEMKSECEKLQDILTEEIGKLVHENVTDIYYDEDRNMVIITYVVRSHCSCCSDDYYSMELKPEWISDPDCYEKHKQYEKEKEEERKKQQKLKEEKEKQEREYQLFIQLKEKYKE